MYFTSELNFSLPNPIKNPLFNKLTVSMSEPPGTSQTNRTTTKTVTGRTLRPRNTDDRQKQKNPRVNDAETGLQWLLDHKIISNGKTDIPTLIPAMHDLAQMDGLPDNYREGIHAFAYVIFAAYSNLNQEKHSEQLDMVKNFISTSMREMKDSVAQEVHNVRSELRGKIEVCIKELKNPRNVPSAFPNTYAQALMSGPKTAQQTNRIAERHAKNARLLTLKPTANSQHDPTKDLSDREILEKAGLALDCMDTSSCPITPKFLSVRKAKTGAITYEMNDARAVQWLNQKTNQNSFLNGFGGTMELRPRFLSVIAELTPVSFKENDQMEIREVELQNNIPENSIQRATWLKPIRRRKPSQRSAHLLLDFTNPEAVNKAIRYGLVIHGTRVEVRKKQIEPLRCLKCQIIPSNHLATHCKQLHDQCGQCRGFHWTSQCPVTDSNQYYCANCRKEGHAAWDRNCPAYTKAVNDLSNRTPDNKYKYFPIQDQPDSWEHVDGTLEFPIMSLLKNPALNTAGIPSPRVTQRNTQKAPNVETEVLPEDTPLFFPSSPSSVEGILNQEQMGEYDSHADEANGRTSRQSRLDEFWTASGNLTQPNDK